MIGFPLGHSFSKLYFNSKFRKENVDARYETFPIESLSELPSIFEENPELEGLNVTIPYKEKILYFIHHIEPEAKLIGAVNTLRIDRLFGNIHLTALILMLPALSKALFLC